LLVHGVFPGGALSNGGSQDASEPSRLGRVNILEFAHKRWAGLMGGISIDFNDVY
jgi:hypothetical protein